MRLTADTPVADIATRLPSAVAVFQQYGIDYCCGGDKALGVACRERGVPYEEVARALAETGSAPAEGARDWTREPLRALADHIVATFHEPLRQELPRLEDLAGRVRATHGEKAPELLRSLEAVVQDLRSTLTLHMEKEEVVLFPAIRGLEAGDVTEIALGVPIAVMEDEHDLAGQLLARLRHLTGEYAVPEWGCRSVRALYEGLEHLERSMHLHVHLENNVLFPRAIRLSGGGAARPS